MDLIALGLEAGSLGVALFRGSQLIGYANRELLTLDCDGVAERIFCLKEV
jgi:hypothetical protein